MSCPFCGKALGDGFLARHICPHCGKPQPPEAENYFSALGVPEKFHQDLALLQKRFYEASRVLHPDRFTSADPQSRQHSLERMSLINEAYRTLKSSEEIREYILKLRGTSAEKAGEKKASMPLDLAESWFEVQDAVLEQPETAAEKISVFERQLAEFRKTAELSIASQERAFDQNPSTEEKSRILQDLSQKSLELNYLKSLDRDVERMKSR